MLHKTLLLINRLNPSLVYSYLDCVISLPPKLSLFQIVFICLMLCGHHKVFPYFIIVQLKPPSRSFSGTIYSE